MNHPHPAVRRAYERMEQLADRLDADLLICDRCGHPLVVRQTQISENPCKNDIRLKCPTTDTDLVPPESDPGNLGVDLDGCGWWTRHGIPFSREEFEAERERRDHRLVDAVTTPIPDSGDTDARNGFARHDRLRALGYIDI